MIYALQFIFLLSSSIAIALFSGFLAETFARRQKEIPPHGINPMFFTHEEWSKGGGTEKGAAAIYRYNMEQERKVKLEER